MLRGERPSLDGMRYTANEAMNEPPAVSRIPVMIGGGGERKTLRMVAQYAQACNLFPGPELEHKLDVLRGHCEDLGRDYDDISPISGVLLGGGDQTMSVSVDVDVVG